MKIAICDDIPKDLEWLKTLILQCENCPEDTEFLEFFSGEQLLENFSKFDLVFLDIKLNGADGTQVGRLIRIQDPEVPIVFFTSQNVFAQAIVKIHPIHYLKKEDSIQILKTEIEDILKKVLIKNQLPLIQVAHHGVFYVLSLSDILYISIYNKGTEIWLKKERRTEIFGNVSNPKNPLEPPLRSKVKLTEYYEQLKNHGFLYAKTSYIINAQYIIRVLPNTVILAEGYCELPVARNRKKEFLEQFVEYLSNSMH